MQCTVPMDRYKVPIIDCNVPINGLKVPMNK